jgi:hypothetical protein
MKKFIFLTISSLLLLSCSLDDSSEGFTPEIVPVSSVEMPTAFRVDSITEIPVTYIRPTSCHVFSNFYYNSIGNERTVAVYCTKINNSNCIDDGGSNYPLTIPLSFKPSNTGTYNFRFWTGINDLGIDQYIEHEIVVDH